MVNRKRKVLLVSSQPIQNSATLRLMGQHPDFDVLTAYCSLPDPKLWRDDEHLNKAAFDTDALDGYQWKQLSNWSPLPRLGKAYGLINPGVIGEVLRSDSVIVYGHSYVTFWLAMITARLANRPLILTTDATSLGATAGWKNKLKKRLLPFLYNRLANCVLVPSSAAKNFLCSIGIDENRIAITPYVVDNDLISALAASTDVSEVRARLQIPAGARVVTFCGKFIARKRPHDAIQAFARAELPGSFLVMVGDGPLADTLRDESSRLGIADRVRFTGLVKYSQLPEVYAVSDVLLVPSEFEPYGLPVNEAMICGTPVIASDRVGAARDLIREGETGYTYPCADVDALAAKIRDTIADESRLRKMREAAQIRMQTWSPRENALATLSAVEQLMTAKDVAGNVTGSAAKPVS
jgi:glycosyltransferase involved in cell wall biosynthesis